MQAAENCTTGWATLPKHVRESYRQQFDDFIRIGRELGLRVEDDQTPHGPDVAPPSAETMLLPR